MITFLLVFFSPSCSKTKIKREYMKNNPQKKGKFEIVVYFFFKKKAITSKMSTSIQVFLKPDVTLWSKGITSEADVKRQFLHYHKNLSFTTKKNQSTTDFIIVPNDETSSSSKKNVKNQYGKDNNAKIKTMSEFKASLRRWQKNPESIPRKPSAKKTSEKKNVQQKKTTTQKTSTSKKDMKKDTNSKQRIFKRHQVHKKTTKEEEEDDDNIPLIPIKKSSKKEMMGQKQTLPSKKTEDKMLFWKSLKKDDPLQEQKLKKKSNQKSQMKANTTKEDEKDFLFWNKLLEKIEDMQIKEKNVSKKNVSFINDSGEETETDDELEVKMSQWKKKEEPLLNTKIKKKQKKKDDLSDFIEYDDVSKQDEMKKEEEEDEEEPSTDEEGMESGEKEAERQLNISDKEAEQMRIAQEKKIKQKREHRFHLGVKIEKKELAKLINDILTTDEPYSEEEIFQAFRDLRNYVIKKLQLHRSGPLYVFAKKTVENFAKTVFPDNPVARVKFVEEFNQSPKEADFISNKQSTKYAKELNEIFE